MSGYFQKKLSEYSRERDLPNLISGLGEIDRTILMLSAEQTVADYGIGADVDQALQTISTLKALVERLSNPRIYDLVDFDVAIRSEELRLSGLLAAQREAA